MDSAIATLIVAALFGAYRLIKDVHDKKTTKIWLIAIESGLIVSILFIGIFGRLYQRGKDTENRDALNKRVENLATHDDSSISQARRDIIDSGSVNFRQLKDPIDNLQKENQAQRQVIAIDRKPSITIQPDAQGANPRLENATEDSINCTVKFQNCGSASANSFHSRTIYLRCDNHENPDSILRHVVTDINASDKVLPLCLKGAFQSTHKIKYQPHLNATLVACITYCYKDSLGRKYGPTTNMFEWFKYSSEKEALIVDPYGYERCKQFLIAQHLWNDKFF